MYAWTATLDLHLGHPVMIVSIQAHLRTALLLHIGPQTTPPSIYAGEGFMGAGGQGLWWMAFDSLSFLTGGK
jgi:hypothetical protein